jgi:RNA polymerase sigma-70 factor (ECF subfamily)
MRRFAVTLAVALLASQAGPAAAEGPGAAPRVVATSPAAGARDVDPALTEISVTFSEPMLDRSWSWSYEDAGKFPQMTGEPRYTADGRTCVLPVRLVAGRQYVVWINTARHRNFRSKGGVPAEPFRLAFGTR